MLFALIAGIALIAPSKFDFYADKPYDPSIPKPDATLGYAIGDRTTNFRDQERALMAVVNASGKRVKVFEYGKSWEGRPLRIYAVSSPENMDRLDEIRRDNEERAQGKDVKTKDPVFVWVNECIHGDETASFESGMALLYNLAASRGPRIRAMLDKAIVLINPCYNPDGHERYTVYYDSIATGSPEPGAYEDSQPSAIYGRLNHYRFDMNRDRVAMSQQETREEVAEFLKWRPQVYIDQHGQVETYFFPPNAMSQNANIDRDRVNKWTDIFGRATGKAFDQNGWTYFVKDTFDLYYPGYLDSFTTLSGAIGMTHETDGGRLLAHRRQDDTILTLRDGVMKHFTSALAVIGAAGAHHDDLLASFIDFKKKAVTGQFAGKFKRVIVQGEVPALRRFALHLLSAGIQSSLSAKPIPVSDAHDYYSSASGKVTIPGPALIVDMAQEQGPLAKALLEPGSDFEPEFTKAQLGKKKTAPDGETYPGPEGTEFYDTTAWALPYAYDLRAWWCESTPKVEGADDKFLMFTALGVGLIGRIPDAEAGVAVPYLDQEDALCVARLLSLGLHASVTTREMTVGGKTLPRGTFLFLSARNEPGYDLKISAAIHGYIPLSSSYPDSGRVGPGSETVVQLRKPKIGIVFGNGASMAQVGSIWYVMDQVFHLPFTPLSTNALNGDLSSYTCIVVPAGAGATMTQKLRDWVMSGGCVVALGGLNWITGASGVVELQGVGGEHQDLPGSLFRAKLDPRSFLSYGYAAPKEGLIEIPVPVEGSDFLKARKEGGSVVRFSDDEKATKLLSGWSWPEDTEKALTGAVWLQDVPLGRGHAVLFTYDPTARAMWPGLYRLVLNAMLIGPSA